MSYLTEERKMIQQAARDFAVSEVLPDVLELGLVVAGVGFGIVMPSVRK